MVVVSCPLEIDDDAQHSPGRALPRVALCAYLLAYSGQRGVPGGIRRSSCGYLAASLRHNSGLWTTLPFTLTSFEDFTGPFHSELQYCYYLRSAR